MTEVISVRFKSGCKAYYFEPNGISAVAGDPLVVETAQGLELVQCVLGNHKVPDGSVVQPLRPVLRHATEADLRAASYARRRNAEAFRICQQKILEHGLEMKLVRVESNFEGNRLVFYFTADGRVDFRELVKDLAFVFHSRIELRQIGVRDEAKMLGGLGICGQPFCCSRFLEDFIPVSIKMAKTQNLSLNPTKISGTCGRLMCCLKYEQDAYEEGKRHLPKVDSFVQTPDGLGNVSELQPLRGRVMVKLDSGENRPYFPAELRVLRLGKGSREDIVVPEELPQRIPVEKELPFDDAVAAPEAEPERRTSRRRNPKPVHKVESVRRSEAPAHKGAKAEAGSEGGESRPARHRRPPNAAAAHTKSHGAAERHAERPAAEEKHSAPKKPYVRRSRHNGRNDSRENGKTEG